MAKTLITFLGASVGTRQYRPAKYRLQAGREAEHTFIAAYLLEAVGFDKILMIGTPKSMWEEVYKYFAQLKGNFDQHTYEKIGAYSTQANYQTPPDEEIVSLVESALPEGCSVIMIRYGLDNKELDENIQTLLDTEAIFSAGDKISLDITHSFRSLPLMGMMLIQYIKEVSLKNIKIEAIYYGMLDITMELGYTPVVNLKKINTVLNWIKVVNNIKERYDFHQLSNILRARGTAYKPLWEAIDELNTAIQANALTRLDEVLSQTNQLIQQQHDLLQNDKEITFMLRYVEEFTEEINGLSRQWEKNLNIAEKHFQNGFIGLSVLALWEAVMDRLFELRNIKGKAGYESHYKVITNHIDTLLKEKKLGDLGHKLNIIKLLRNDIAHGKSVKKAHIEQYPAIIKMLKTELATESLKRFIP